MVDNFGGMHCKTGDYWHPDVCGKDNVEICASRCCNGYHVEVRDLNDFHENDERDGVFYVRGLPAMYVWIKDEENDDGSK